MAVFDTGGRNISANIFQYDSPKDSDYGSYDPNVSEEQLNQIESYQYDQRKRRNELYAQREAQKRGDINAPKMNDYSVDQLDKSIAEINNQINDTMTLRSSIDSSMKGERRATDSSPRRNSPSLGESRSPKIERSVVLPEPEGPAIER